MGSWGLDTVEVGTYWGVLIVLLCATSAQLGLDIVDQMWVQFRMGFQAFTMLWGGAWGLSVILVVI